MPEMRSPRARAEGGASRPARKQPESFPAGGIQTAVDLCLGKQIPATSESGVFQPADKNSRSRLLRGHPTMPLSRECKHALRWLRIPLSTVAKPRSL